MDFDLVARRLAALERRRIVAGNLRPAAVLVPFFLKQGEPHLLMVVRTGEVEHHKHQIAFPGGVCEAQDRDAVATALRECEEETGLEQRLVRVLGLSHDTKTITGFRITPVVGQFPYPYSFRPNPAEVARLLEVPWRLFGSEEHHRVEVVEVGADRHRVDFFTFHGQVIWGASARIARQLYEVLNPAVAKAPAGFKRQKCIYVD